MHLSCSQNLRQPFAVSEAWPCARPCVEQALHVHYLFWRKQSSGCVCGRRGALGAACGCAGGGLSAGRRRACVGLRAVPRPARAGAARHHLWPLDMQVRTIHSALTAAIMLLPQSHVYDITTVLMSCVRPHGTLANAPHASSSTCLTPPVGPDAHAH